MLRASGTEAPKAKALRRQEMRAQESYEHFVVAWHTRPGGKDGCAIASNRQGLLGLPGICGAMESTTDQVDLTLVGERTQDAAAEH